MNTKLTLTIDDSVVKKTKEYAKRKKMSLSQLVEFYFHSLTSASSDKPEKLPPITAKLSGMLEDKKISDYKKAVSDALIEKYL